MKIIFFDCNAECIRGYKRHLGDLAECIVQDVRQVDADVLISPANSYGVMDGGIDEFYMAMFPSVQPKVQAAIAEQGILDRWRKPHLPVGSALLVPVTDHFGNKKQLVCAPTMRGPQSLRRTPDNVYWAMRAILECLVGLPEDCRVAVPCLGTGVGSLTGEESGVQVSRAMRDHAKGQVAPNVIRRAPGVYLAVKP